MDTTLYLVDYGEQAWAGRYVVYDDIADVEEELYWSDVNNTPVKVFLVTDIEEIDAG